MSSKLVLVLAVLASPSLAQKPKKSAEPAPPPARVETIEAIDMTLSFPAQLASIEPEDLEQGAEPDPDDLGDWRAELGGKTVFVSLWKTDDGPEPADGTSWIRDWVAGDDYDKPPFEFRENALIPGPYGSVPYASLLAGVIREEGSTADSGYVWYLAGVAESTSYMISIEVQPAPSEAERQVVRAFLEKGVTVACKGRDPRWTEEEIRERWDRDSALSEKDKQDLKVLRTAHYLVMTNSSGADAFAKQMEANYAAIQKTYPFPEIPGRKLMPVFLFRDPEEYYAFYRRAFDATLEEAEDSKGVAWKDFYATWYEAPKDPVHIHEATHQIFANRLELEGAGSWFQEGVAEYIETRANDRNDVARRVKDGEHTSLRELMRLESLLGSSEDDASGESAAGLHYRQAALLVEFLRESKFGQKKFLDWMHAVGNVPDNDLVRIEATLRRIYGVGIDELDRLLQEYCRKR